MQEVCKANVRCVASERLRRPRITGYELSPGSSSIAYAASGARATANSAPPDRATLLDYTRELLETPAPAPVTIVEPADAA